MQWENTIRTKTAQSQRLFVIIPCAPLAFSLLDDAEDEFKAIHTTEDRRSAEVLEIQTRSLTFYIIVKNVFMEFAVYEL